MKAIFKNMTWMLSATLIMAACSDSLDESTNTPVQGPVVGEGYVKVAINMPTTSGNSTRSTDNGGDKADVTLEEGEADEYNVENAILAFFKCKTESLANSTPEAQATFVKAYALTKGELGITGSSETPQVTEQVSVITEAPKVSDGEQLYVLAILNNNNTVSANNGNLTVNGTDLTSTSTLADLQNKITFTTSTTYQQFVYQFTGGSDENPRRNQFTMTNAPLSDKAGVAGTIGSAKAYTLVPVTVYDTKAQATAGNVAKIYVERVVAKVTLTTPGNAETINVSGDGNSGDQVQITGWCLNVTNNSTKLVRDVSGFKATDDGWLASDSENSPARFAGTRGIKASFGVSGEGDYYRIYWAEDCNYISAEPTTDFTTYSGTNAPAAWNGLSTSTTSNACYCLENTMNYDQQIQNRTTGVLIKTSYLTKFQGETQASAKSFFICGTSSTKYPEAAIGGGSTSGGTDAFVTYVMTEADKLITTESYKFNGTGLSLQTSLASGTYTDITNVFTFTATDAKLTDQQNAVKAVVGSRISYYKNGDNYYYSSLIRHFQDGEGVGIPTSGIASANDYTLKHLGRYGVVRNNWYEININSISGPGDPVIPEPGEDPDDTAEGYINCTINILSWAKRSQNVDL
ncbi:Mfa1 family fimbria major subunit [uncultured Bacteroides sp.]|uniref:Mfa1 family fimbria major subunit n=1 Tax=uncultured Bacteroides sp. TaxID=162156 RepID=UPI0026663FC7|nr:Mfa1 family fimbria major subunit [uncultured Bacteroides sp.]